MSQNLFTLLSCVYPSFYSSISLCLSDDHLYEESIWQFLIKMNMYLAYNAATLFFASTIEGWKLIFTGENFHKWSLQL